MFVSIICDMGSDANRSELYNLLPQYGFEKVQRGCFESAAVNDQQLSNLKRDIDKITDYYDAVRIYQYPVEGTLVLTVRKENKWRRIVVKKPQEAK